MGYLIFAEFDFLQDFGFRIKLLLLNKDLVGF